MLKLPLTSVLKKQSSSSSFLLQMAMEMNGTSLLSTPGKVKMMTKNFASQNNLALVCPKIPAAEASYLHRYRCVSFKIFQLPFCLLVLSLVLDGLRRVSKWFKNYFSIIQLYGLHKKYYVHLLHLLLSFHSISFEFY